MFNTDEYVTLPRHTDPNLIVECVRDQMSEYIIIEQLFY